jgi:hypothetical protein
MREAMRNANAPTNGAEQAANDTVTALERQLAVLQSSEAEVKMQEELAKARNQVEYDRIFALQNAIMLQGTMNDLVKQEAEEKKKAQEAAAKEAQRVAKNLTPDMTPQQATQGRLLVRGTGGDIQGQILSVLKQAFGVQQQQLRALQEYLRSKERDPYTLTKLVVP